ncbi:MAG: hypothetical protein O2970_11515 [Proteobacteria bacterium]|nr:hypothetical protein [Pseudomonadota bacterium]
MNGTKYKFILFICLILNLSSPTNAQNNNQYNESTTAELLKKYIRAGIQYDIYLKNIQNSLQSFRNSFDAINKENVEKYISIEKAKVRAQEIERILKADLNNDGNVTLDELQAIYKERNGQSNRTLSLIIEKSDKNKDNVITFKEMRNIEIPTKNIRAASHVTEMLSLDPNGDGTLDETEIEKIANKTFNLFDRNGDSTISSNEIKMVGCNLPNADSNEIIAVYSAYRGQAISSVSTVGQDIETNTINISIKEGKEPIYLLLPSHKAMIWSITGDTNRISKLVVTSVHSVKNESSGVGVIGVKKEKIYFLKSNQCIQHFESGESSQALLMKGLLSDLLGRQPDIILSIYETKNDSIVSRVIQSEKGSSDFNTSQYSEGVVDLKISDIISDSKLEQYDIYPEEIGIIQLIKKGKIKQMSEYKTYKIIKPIKKFPAGLAGGNSVTFIIGKGVPLPEGKAGHSCVISEETGKPLLNERLCR